MGRGDGQRGTNMNKRDLLQKNPLLQKLLEKQGIAPTTGPADVACSPSGNGPGAHPTERPVYLPGDLARSRIMGSAETAAFFNYSLPHFRRLVKAGVLPQPVRLSERKLGWRVGDCIDCVASQSHSAE